MKLCHLCGHTLTAHRGIVCGERDCDCLCFLEPTDNQPLPPISDTWQEKVIMAVLDCVVEGREAEIRIKTKDDTECHVKVCYVPSIGMTVTQVGKA